MPDEYISREAMLEHLDRCKQSEDATTLTAAVITALQCFVQSQPTADVAEVRHGEWEIVVGSNGKEYMVCTCCRVSQDLTGVFTYCPNCGAKMDGDDSDAVDGRRRR